MDPQVKDILTYVGGAVVAAGSLFGIGTLMAICLKHYFKKRDHREEIHETNQGKVIDQDQSAFQMMSDRLKKLEEWYKELSEKLTSQMEQNAQLRTENKYLKEQLEEVKSESKDRLDRIRTLEAEVRDLQQQMNEMLAIQRGEM